MHFRKITFCVLIGLLLVITFQTNAQSYLGWAIKTANLREKPSTDASVMRKIKAGSNIFIITANTENDFYPVLDIQSNTEGYIHKSLVKFGDSVAESNGLFTAEDEGTSTDSEIQVYNDTSKELTLKLNNIKYNFNPHAQRVITITPGYYSFIASAAGVRPNIGNETLDSNRNYSWKFYIVSSRW